MRKSVYRTHTHIVIFIVLFSIPSFIYAYLGTSGRVFVDTNGDSVQLRGFGLGGWLVQEGYMWNTSGFYGSTSVIEQKLIELVGDSSAQNFYQNYYSAYVAEEDVAQLAERGFNSLRLPFHYKFFSSDTGVFINDGFEIIDPLLQWCSTYGIYLILDMHCAPGGQNRNDFSDGNGEEAGLWVHEYNRDWTVSIWKHIADYYSESQWIGGYDLINEPVLEGGFSSSDLRQFYIEIVDSIRTVDQNHIIFIEGNWYGNDFANLTPPFDDNMSYSFHHYVGPSTQTAWVDQYTSMSESYNVPLWVGEVGENSNHWGYHKIKLFEQHNIGWSWWNYKHNGSISVLMRVEEPDGYNSILKYWSNLGPKPSKVNAENGLQDLVTAYQFENCVSNTGLIAAFNDPNFSIKPTPFADHHIPGSLAVVEYDIGINGVSYEDEVFEDPDKFGGNSQSWNTGWTYRNDGVDIQRSTDNVGAEYNIGWTNAGDWTGYTLQSDSSGIYTVSARIASNVSGGRLRLLYNEETIGEVVTIPKTGGWQDWEYVFVGEHYIEQGDGYLQLHVVDVEFNIKDINFVFVGKPQVAADRYGNYPNPFTYETTIFLSIPLETNGSLTIYNYKGQLVKRLFNGNFSPGNMEITWKGTNHQYKTAGSGVYIYQLKTDLLTRSGKMLLIK
jgi:hypothetical protein